MEEPGQPGLSAGPRRRPRRTATPGSRRQAVPALRPAFRRPVAAGRHRPVLYQRAELILADEPVSAMDPVLAGHTLALLNREAAARGSTLLASLHAVDLALQHFPGDRAARRTHRLRPARRRSRPRRAGRPLRQRTTAGRARQPGRRTRRGAHPTMLNAASPPRDPAALPRLLLTLAALLLLWPGLRLSELDIPGLFSGDNARTMGGFLAGFWPPAHDPGFLALLGRATWKPSPSPPPAWPWPGSWRFPPHCWRPAPCRSRHCRAAACRPGGHGHCAGRCAAC